jgi:hypothetical protein
VSFSLRTRLHREGVLRDGVTSIGQKKLLFGLKEPRHAWIVPKSDNHSVDHAPGGPDGSLSGQALNGSELAKSRRTKAEAVEGIESRAAPRGTPATQHGRCKLAPQPLRTAPQALRDNDKTSRNGFSEG